MSELATSMALTWLAILVLCPTLLLASECPMSCFCDYMIQEVRCNNVGNISWTRFYRDLPANVEQLSIRDGDFDEIPEPSRKLRPFLNLKSLKIADSSINSLEPGAFRLFPLLQELNLAHNNISKINASHFSGLEELKVLNLSNNELREIETKTFHNWTNLEVLDLSYNDLNTIPPMEAMNNLHKIDLSYSNIKYIHPNTFADLSSLDVLNLRGNMLDTLHIATFANATVQEMYLARNPWDCHCGITWLVEEQHLSDIYKDSDDIVCQAPVKFFNQKVKDLDPAALYCDSPSVFSTSNNQSIQYLHSTVLDCNASTPASVYWITPRGILVHPNHRRWLPPTITEYAHRLTYNGQPTHWQASIEALGNGSLLVSKFRMYFAGKYTCVAENPEGVDSQTVILEIYTVMNTVMEAATLLGYSMAIGCLIMGIIIGATRMCLERHCKCCKPPEKPPSIEDKDTSDETTAHVRHDLFDERHWTDDRPYQYDYDPTMRSPSLSPRMSPIKCVTPAEYVEDYDEDEDGLAPPHLTDDIKELLILVRASLRHRLESGTERVRTVMHDNATVEHIRERARTLQQSLRTTGTNLRESSTLTLQRWRSNSYQYASRARTGITVGFEQAKTHVQSMKEFCGTGGEPGGSGMQTVSIRSMETDVDSNESKEIVKSVTIL